MAAGVNEYAITIVNASLFVKKAAIAPAVQKAHILALERTTVKYPLRPVECKVYSIPTGALSHTHENLFLGALPKRLVLCCIDNKPVSRQEQRHQLRLRVRRRSSDTRQTLPAQLRRRPLRQELREHVHLDRQDMAGRGNCLTREEYRDGYTYFCFDLTPDQCDGPCFNLVQKGNLRLKFHFRAALQTTVNVVAYAEFESVLEIDKNRNVIYDY